MTDLIERVARALSGADDPDGHQWYQVNPEYWERLARAAIEAMREPSEGMVRAGYREDSEYANDEDTAHQWRRMIEAALKGEG